MDNAKNKSMSHYEWEQNKKGNSWKAQIRIDIDEIIKVSSSPKQFETLLQDRGYEIKHGAHIAFRKNGMERYARGKTLGKDYTQDAISTRIKFATLGYDTKTSTLKRTYTSNKKTYTPRKGHVTLLGTNIALTRMIIKELTKRKEYYKISKPRIKRNDTIIKALAMQLEILREHNIITTQDLTDKITMLNAELTLLRKDIRANERKKENVKPMNEKLFELKREISKFEKARNDITEAHKEIKRTKKIDEQQQNNRKTKDIYNER
jgi:predicted RNase H-like nuclease (RuvC/YqgF family)